MFFIVSKLIDFLFSPTNWVLGLLIAFLFVKNQKIKMRLVYSAIALFILFTNPFFINQAMHKWELKGITYKGIKQKYEAGIVLGGFMKYYNSELKTLSFGDASDRLMEGLMLYRKGRIEKIIISSGSGSLVKGDKEALLAKNFLIDYCAVPDSVILIDTLSRNTYENAVETKKIIEREKIKSAMLITSAYHMRRASKCFHKLGVNIEAYCTDQYSGKQMYYPSDLIIPDTDNLYKWEILTHEILGCIVYKIRGYN